MGQALYRTYRSKKLSEVVGQEHITQALTTALEKGLINHAYLFTGPRGVGKTSIARILAHEINNLPYDDDSSHLDIIEIDAASNRRIDEIRDLRDKVHIAPTSAKYKVYIIDEVHMLTREAFNALLKTLEEPPAHVVFVLATTEVHKLPETIISRTQRFTFRPGTQETIASHLRAIADKEKMQIDDDALSLIARHGGGSFRDSIGVLDQMRSLGHDVGKRDVESLLGIAPTELITTLFSAVEQHDAPEVINTLQQLHDQGATPAQVAKQLGEVLREHFIANSARLSHAAIVALLTKLLDVPVASNPATYLEIVLLDVALEDRQGGPASRTPQKTSSESDKAVRKQDVKAAHVTPIAAIVEEPARKKAAPGKPSKDPAAGEKGFEPQEVEIASKSDQTLDDAVWPQVVNTIKKDHNTLYSILRTALPTFEPGKVSLEVGFAFHQKRLNEARNKKIIAETIQKVSGLALQVECILGEAAPEAAPVPDASGEIAHTVGAASSDVAAITDKPNSAKTAEDSSTDYYIAEAERASERPVDTVSNIFGGGELLES